MTIGLQSVSEFSMLQRGIDLRIVGSEGIREAVEGEDAPGTGRKQEFNSHGAYCASPVTTALPRPCAPLKMSFVFNGCMRVAPQQIELMATILL